MNWQDTVISASDEAIRRTTEAYIFIDSQPRHLLGAFAAPLDLVATRYASMYYRRQRLYSSHDVYEDPKIKKFIEDSLYKEMSALPMDKEIGSREYGYDLLSLAEVTLWWKTTKLRIEGTPVMKFSANGSDLTPKVAEHLAYMEKVLVKPALLEYYEAGIYDEKVIKKAIKHGIDPSLLTSMAQ